MCSHCKQLQFNVNCIESLFQLNWIRVWFSLTAKKYKFYPINFALKMLLISKRFSWLPLYLPACDHLTILRTSILERLIQMTQNCILQITLCTKFVWCLLYFFNSKMYHSALRSNLETLLLKLGVFEIRFILFHITWFIKISHFMIMTWSVWVKCFYKIWVLCTCEFIL